MLAIRTGSGSLVSSLLPIVVEHCKDRNACRSGGGGGGGVSNHACCLQVTRKELAETFALEYTRKPASLYFKHKENTDGVEAARHVCLAQPHPKH